MTDPDPPPAAATPGGASSVAPANRRFRLQTTIAPGDETRWRSIRAFLIVSPLFLAAGGTFLIVGPGLASGHPLTVAELSGELLLLSAAGLLGILVGAGLYLGLRRRFVSLEESEEGLVFVRRDGLRVSLRWKDPEFRLQLWQFPAGEGDALPRQIVVVPGHEIAAGCPRAAAAWILSAAEGHGLNRRESEARLSRELAPFPAGTEVLVTTIGPVEPDAT